MGTCHFSASPGFYRNGKSRAPEEGQRATAEAANRGSDFSQDAAVRGLPLEPRQGRDVEAALRANPAKSNRTIAAITGTLTFCCEEMAFRHCDPKDFSKRITAHPFKQRNQEFPPTLRLDLPSNPQR